MTDVVIERLSARERDVLALVANGLRTKEIAKALSVTCKTVETHRARIYDKTGIRSIAGLTKLAIRCGLSNLENEHP